MCSNTPLYRIVTYKIDNEDKIYKLNNISYTNGLNYSKVVTNVGTKEKLGTYVIKVDKSNNFIDKDQKLVFINDIVKSNNKHYLVVYDKKSQDFGFKSMTTGRLATRKEIYTNSWSVVGNIHKMNKRLF